jgi:hypothetical protein
MSGDARMIDFPPPPKIESLNWQPPAQTVPERIASSANDIKLMIYADADNADYNDWVLDHPSSEGFPRLNNWWENQAPPGPRQLILRQFWTYVPNTYTHLYPGNTFSRSWEYSHGISTMDSQSITIEIGFEGQGLSAGLSATFSHSVTVTEETKETTQYTVNGPKDGEVRVWLLWDLRYEMLLIDQVTSEVVPERTYRGDVGFTNDAHYSGAYLNYPWTRKNMSSGILVADQRDFPAPPSSSSTGR